MTFLKNLIIPLLFIVASSPLLAQGAQVAFGTIQQNSNLPVEVTADSLSIDQKSGTAIFTGNVVIGQGEMRLSAQEVLVVYSTTDQGVARLEATGGVTLVSGEDAAESERADYNVENGTIIMSGNVLVAQGPSALTADKMTVELETGTAQMSGRVKTVLQTGDK